MAVTTLMPRPARRGRLRPTVALAAIMLLIAFTASATYASGFGTRSLRSHTPTLASVLRPLARAQLASAAPSLISLGAPICAGHHGADTAPALGRVRHQPDAAPNGALDRSNVNKRPTADRTCCVTPVNRPHNATRSRRARRSCTLCRLDAGRSGSPPASPAQRHAPAVVGGVTSKAQSARVPPLASSDATGRAFARQPV